MRDRRRVVALCKRNIRTYNLMLTWRCPLLDDLGNRRAA
jgi:hypothetical protein